MERERKPADIFLKRTNVGKNFWVHFILCLLNVCGCTAVGTDTRAAVDIVLSPSGIAVKSVSAEDNGIIDANIFIFSDTGFLERSVYVKGDRYGTTLVKDRRYDMCAPISDGQSPSRPGKTLKPYVSISRIRRIFPPGHL